MGKIKEWAFDEHECVACHQLFVAWYRDDYKEIKPYCSKKCYEEYEAFIKEGADIAESRRQLELNI